MPRERHEAPALVCIVDDRCEPRLGRTVPRAVLRLCATARHERVHDALEGRPRDCAPRRVDEPGLRDARLPSRDRERVILEREQEEHVAMDRVERRKSGRMRAGDGKGAHRPFLAEEMHGGDADLASLAGAPASWDPRESARIG